MALIANVDFFEYAFAFSNETIEVGCCSSDTTLTNVTCGRGTSCIGQCSAIDASLCLSGKCTGNIEDCNPSLPANDYWEDYEKWMSWASRPSWVFKWCLPKKMGAHEGFMNFCRGISPYSLRDIWEWQCLSIVWESPGDGNPPNRKLPRKTK